jgi:hypothetical protein
MLPFAIIIILFSGIANGFASTPKNDHILGSDSERAVHKAASAFILCQRPPARF